MKLQRTQPIPSVGACSGTCFPPFLPLCPWVESACPDRVFREDIELLYSPLQPFIPSLPSSLKPRSAVGSVRECQKVHVSTRNRFCPAGLYLENRPALCLGPELIFQDSVTGSVSARQECGFCLTLFLHFIKDKK